MTRPNGKIVTFYSFKGGVGRTMALANVAFLASMAGKRVLMMDWDLEAPGLEYYFRGLTERTLDEILKDAPGILNLLDDWSVGISEVETEDELSKYTADFLSGVRFRELVRPVVDKGVFPNLMPEGAALDIISAGSKIIGSNGKTYEEVLSTFSWHAFFKDKLGGYLLERLVEWARVHYDVILIDSRTGLADVAGICTLALPDTVALCLVMNQQNIDGIGQVAAAITNQAKNRVQVRIVPMRISRRDSSEGSDSQARAISVLSRVGGLQTDAIRDDLSSLAIASDDNIPFYETLAPFFSVDPALDPLTLSYARLAKELIGPEISVPDLSIETLKLIKGRIQPKNATIQFVLDLRSAEPFRAHSEIVRLINVAADTVTDGQLEAEYIEALCDTVLHVVENSEGESNVLDLLDSTRGILRYLTSIDEEIWRPYFANFLLSSLDIVWIFDNESAELNIREELDRLLASDISNEGLLRQVDNLQEIGRLSAARGSLERVSALITKMGSVLEKVGEQNDLTDSESRSLTIALAKYYLFSGDVNISMDQQEKAHESLYNGLKNLEELGPNLPEDVSRLKFRLLQRLASLRSTSVEDSADYCVRAAALQTPDFHYSAPEMFAIMLRPGVPAEKVIQFGLATFFDVSRRRKIIAYYTRREELLIQFVDLIGKILRLLRKNAAAEIDGVPFMNALVELVSAISRSRTRLSSSILDGVTARIDKVVSDLALNDEQSRKMVGMLENIRILSKARS